jgi:hypothetical protein
MPSAIWSSQHRIGATRWWDVARDLRTIATWCDEVRAIRCLLITAEGPWFSAGGDIGFVSETTDLVVDMAGSTDAFHVAISKVLRMRAPVVIAVRARRWAEGLAAVRERRPANFKACDRGPNRRRHRHQLRHRIGHRPRSRPQRVAGLRRHV